MFRKILIATLLSTFGIGAFASTAFAHESGPARAEVRTEVARRDGFKARKRLGRHRRFAHKHRRAELRREGQARLHLRGR